MDILVGVGIALTQLGNSTTGCPTCTHYDLHEQDTKPAFFVEARSDYGLGLELSYGEADRKAYGEAFTGHNKRKDLDNLTVTMHQVIDVRWYAAQGTYTAHIGNLGLHAGYGRAIVYGHNHEYGTYDYGCGPYQVNNNTYTKEHRPIMSLALEYPVADKWLAQAKYTHMNHIAESEWTISNHMNSATLSIVRSF